MSNSKLVIQNLRFLFCIMCFAFCFSRVPAQSTRVEFPTPVTSNEISGKIAARDIGDSRLTTYYYTFNGNQGDIFLKIQAKNLNGDIDVFYADSMRPLTKISLYADSIPTQTGRELYLRKPEKLILRVEGRTPNDDLATFSIRFEGSFQASTNSPDESGKPTLKNEVTGAVRVNSVGTILEPLEKPLPKKVELIADEKNEEFTTTPKSVSTVGRNKSKSSKDDEPGRTRVVVSDDLPETPKAEPAAKRTTATRRTPVRQAPARTTPKRVPAKRNPPAKTTAEEKAEELAKALENVRLVVLFKDGGKLERPMNEVLRFNIDKGMLTIISKDGSVGRYSIVDVTRVAIE